MQYYANCLMARITISVEESIVAKADRRAKEQKRSLSSYVALLIEEDLRAAGLLSEDEVLVELQRVRELIGARGVAAVKAKLDELSRETVLSVGDAR